MDANEQLSGQIGWWSIIAVSWLAMMGGAGSFVVLWDIFDSNFSVFGAIEPVGLTLLALFLGWILSKNQEERWEQFKDMKLNPEQLEHVFWSVELTFGSQGLPKLVSYKQIDKAWKVRNRIKS